ncbi:tRNA (adenosine(37)-N6)-threonylcarbamoyltransferase complex dimerization subunit type 1 TsaB [Dasania sp. GY-MA-18]|uniref:tRNA threonylcarbamoyladenosine biosynthesis protein TsaB n=1 Tax=Dasania phycosphaerae TaxID=2950436 RepID=A0A9J6RN64_9GAMM|nr:MULTISPECIES: tRNA (adenosine(37)-N6)-threonylcarbamoyltransferase complex dimerization subunit type 1 TsaB [Dasania]MCR8923321.1 tRNA (adenosine(37)-N6)-threonylcarbamoyltransferase complex dimerization subunit type 1 TsaB [Dasania sp. GY-MA-18]MCZ0865753.1 tRNA (adenosine(37)-N6)-threonylcarbamoyltransferase complex dimerization subunit type 1 TsaB [Dasania phycosphaerae]MCZ0869478.1 tRNA (adenosine(37)-N6)-threonylcarbamoyltransferase complex dimerization subunit type 1 TsaB [Dasania phyco
MKILAVDSSTEACSVALLDSQCRDESALLALYELAPREHSQRLLPMVDQLLADAGITIQQLDAIAFGKGPGSFTGLRICLGLVQGLAFGADVPVVPVSSLQALAQTALDLGEVDEQQPVIASIDARMSEIYWCAYRCEQGLMQPLIDEQLSAPEAFKQPQELQSFAAVGSGWQYKEQMAYQGLHYCNDQLLPRASAVAKLALHYYQTGLYCAADKAQPSYIRDQVAWKKISEQ